VDALNTGPKYKSLGMFGGLANILWGGPFVSRLGTAQIELEVWPESAKKEAWSVYGKRITKYNKIFERHRKTVLTK
jgi:hypothetical protein